VSSPLFRTSLAARALHILDKKPEHVSTVDEEWWFIRACEHGGGGTQEDCDAFCDEKEANFRSMAGV